MYWHKMLWKFAEWEPSCSFQMGGHTDGRTDRHDFLFTTVSTKHLQVIRPTASIQTLCNMHFEVTLPSDVRQTMPSIYVIAEGLLVDTWICSVRRDQKSVCYTKMSGKYCLEGHTWLDLTLHWKWSNSTSCTVLQQGPNRIAKSRTTAVFVEGLCDNNKNNGSLIHECFRYFKSSVTSISRISVVL
jgi:hypothetical protein